MTKRIKWLAALTCVLGLAGAAISSGFAAEAAGRVALSVKDVGRLALENSPDVQILKFDASISRSRLAEDQSLFDTILQARAGYGDDQTKKASSLLGTKSTETDLGISLSKKFVTGTDVTVELGDNRTFTNSTFASLNPAYEATVGISLRQPLGNNALGLIDRGEIDITRLDIAGVEQGMLTGIEQVLATALAAYWQLVLRGEQLHIAEQAFAKAEELLSYSQKKHDIGLMEKAELLAAKANLSQRRTTVINQEHALVRAKYELFRALFEDDLSLEVATRDDLAQQVFVPSLEESLRQAISNRRDYRQAQQQVESNNINVSLKKNGRWPEIDLEASLLHNGLETSKPKAWRDITDQSSAAWTAGVSVRVPLENKEARALYTRAKQEQEKALVSLKKIEHAIVIDIATALDVLHNGSETVALQEKVVALQQEKLEAEGIRFQAGRSNSDILIRYQQDLLQARLVLAQLRFEYQRAAIGLQQAEHSLLSRYWQGTL